MSVRQIDLLCEYRTRLIADVVTGKLDVRESAAKIPQKTNKSVCTNNFDDFTDREKHIDTEFFIKEVIP